MNRIRRTTKQQNQASSEATIADPEPDPVAAQQEVPAPSDQDQEDRDALLGMLPEGMSLTEDSAAGAATNGVDYAPVAATEVPVRSRRAGKATSPLPSDTQLPTEPAQVQEAEPEMVEAAAVAEVAERTGLDAAGPAPLAADEAAPATEEVPVGSATEVLAEETMLADETEVVEDRDTDPELDTSPQLQPLDQEALTSLPINFVVDSKYVVGSLLHHAEDRNLYRVSTRKQQKCPQCGRISASSLADCPHCGTVLIGIPTADFYLMAESHIPAALMQDPGIMDLNLYHPNLVPVIDFFSHKPFGHTRYYAVAEPRQGVRLSQLSLPRSGGQVLNWAMQLADALDYLHSRGVVGAGAEADDILVQGDRASLASLQNARTHVESADEMTQQQVIDLARLAGTMYEAYTGYPAAMSPEGILPMPSSAPEQVGAAFRTAIEPAQGIAQPVSAARWRDLLAVALEAVAELERPGTPVAFTAAGLTNPGRLRDNNQDSFGMTEFVQGSAERPLRIGLYVIADGLGGHKGGEIASALAVQAFYGEVMARVVSPLIAAPAERSTLNNEAIFAGMVRAVQSANERIYRARDNRLNDMGTTIVAALVIGGKAYIVNVGDSRLYHYARPRGSAEAAVRETAPIFKGTTPLAGTAPLMPPTATDVPADAVAEPIDRTEYTLSQVSVDHSLVHRLVELGQLDPEEAKVHPHRNFIYRSLGGPPPVEVDTFVRTLQPGDRILLCSDGLNSMVEDEMIEGVLAAADDPNLAAHNLIELANEAGGHDNITTIVIDVTDYLPMADHPTALNNI
jgi:serine/threonine protein phosphatase PrpC